MDHYLDPMPLPPFGRVVDQLIDLWADQQAHLADCHDPDRLRPWEPRVDVPARVAAMKDQVARIRDWMASGCPDRDRATTRVADGMRKRSGGGAGQRWPEDCREPAMTWLERVRRLAAKGHWVPDTLNPALLDLATRLVAVELHDAEERVERVERLLEIFCATRNNGSSDRLEGVERVEQLPGSVLTAISEAIATAESRIERFARAREKYYSRPLKVVPLLTGEGKPDASGGDPESTEREHYHPFIGGHFVSPPATMEELLESGRLDEPLPGEIEAIIERAVRRGDAPRFLRRLVN